MQRISHVEDDDEDDISSCEGLCWAPSVEDAGNPDLAFRDPRAWGIACCQWGRGRRKLDPKRVAGKSEDEAACCRWRRRRWGSFREYA
jgi:hypothetical protein